MGMKRSTQLGILQKKLEEKGKAPIEMSFEENYYLFANQSAFFFKQKEKGKTVTYYIGRTFKIAQSNIENESFMRVNIVKE